MLTGRTWVPIIMGMENSNVTGVTVEWYIKVRSHTFVVEHEIDSYAPKKKIKWQKREIQ